MTHRSLCGQSAALLALCALVAQAQPVSPLVGQWTEAKVGQPTTTIYRPNGTYTVTLPLSEQLPLVIKGHYTVKGNLLVCTATKMAIGKESAAWPPKSDGVTQYERVDKNRFSIAGNALTVTSADGFQETCTRAASSNIVQKP